MACRDLVRVQRADEPPEQRVRARVEELDALDELVPVVMACHTTSWLDELVEVDVDVAHELT